jgi:hypothetical protein
MKKFVSNFMLRGLVTCGFGPVVLAVVYLVLHQQGVVHTLAVTEVCMGIFSLFALAFVAGGMNAIYQIERIPVMLAILIHGVVLYVSYLIVYLVNDWLKWGFTPILVYSAIFVVGYLMIWAIIYSVNKRNAERINEQLKQRQKNDSAL